MLMDDDDFELDYKPIVVGRSFFVADGKPADERISEALKLGLVLKSVTSGRKFVFGRPDQP